MESQEAIDMKEIEEAVDKKIEALMAQFRAMPHFREEQPHTQIRRDQPIEAPIIQIGNQGINLQDLLQRH